MGSTVWRVPVSFVCCLLPWGHLSLAQRGCNFTRFMAVFARSKSCDTIVQKEDLRALNTLPPFWWK